MNQDTNTAIGAADDSLLLCASDLQHSAIYDNHVEMQACIRAVANRIAALASAAAPAPQPNTAYAALPECSAFLLCKGSDVTARAWNADQMRAFADATHALRAQAAPNAPLYDPRDVAFPAAPAAPQPAVQQGDDADLARTVDERDAAEAWADGLAGLIGEYFGQEIGEHSSAHNPWQEARDIIEEALAVQSQEAAPVAQWGAEVRLIAAVDEWFVKNTGLGGCSDKDVQELQAIFAAHPAARAPADSATAPAGGAVSAPVFAFRRKGLDDFCTCTEERYAELSAKPNLFETRIFYTTPPTQAADSVLEDAARLERERICAAIKAEDDYCVDHGDYMLDSDDCIKIVRGEWVRPDFSVDAARKQGGAT